jgi:ABC-2 type transport system permease protein
VSLLPPASAAWLLAHEMRLTWRGYRAGRAGKGPGAVIGLVLLFAFACVGGVTVALATHGHAVPIHPLAVAIADLACAVVLTLMLSQTLGASAEALYERGDLDLLFSSPIAPRKVLLVRALGVATGVATIFMVFIAPLLLPSVLYGHPGWLGVFGVLIALALTATALGLSLAMALFALIGPRRTRTVAQVLAALVGAAFFLASQYRTLMGGAATQNLYVDLTQAVQTGRLVPPPYADLPLRAMLGEPLPLIGMLALGGGLFWLAAMALGRRFSDAAAAAQGASSTRVRGRGKPAAPFAAGAFRATIRKELRLIGRDATLLSQVLLRVLYLLPLALMLARSAKGVDAAALAGGAGFVAFMAGQVAGSLAWITLSAEDTPDLLAVSPTPVSTLRRAKLTAAMIPVALLLALPIAALTVFQPLTGLITAIGAGLAAWCCGLINLWHQKPGKRADFRRRRGASWFATLAEIFIGGLIAGATTLMGMGLVVWGALPLIVAGALMMVLRRTDDQIARALRLAS